MFDLDLSLAVQQRMKDHLRTSRCWHNASVCVTHDPSLNNCLYVEGHIVKNGHDGHLPSVIEHGWIETPDGKIIDPTLAGPVVTIEYFPGLKFDVEEVKKLSRKTKERPFYASIYHHDSPEYEATFTQAWDYVTQNKEK